MTGLTLRLELRRSRLVAFWLAVIILAYGGIIAAMFPILEENSELLEDYLNILPEGMLAAFGMSGNLTDPGVFFSTYIGSFLWPVVAALGAIILATRPVAADVERGWTEVVLGTPLTRAASVVFWLFACAIAGVTSLVAALTLSRGTAAGVAAGVLLVMYLMNIVAELQADLSWLASFGWFKYLTVTDLIDAGEVPWSSIAVFGVVAVAGWTASLLVFRRRDLLA